jgi:hypothetical protein
MRAIRLAICCLLVASFGTSAAARKRTEPTSDLVRRAPVASDLRPGMLYSVHGVTVKVPPPGEGVWFDAHLDGGGAIWLGLQSDRHGKVSIQEDATTPGLQMTASSSTDPCSDGAYKLAGIKWQSTYSWWYQSGSTPSAFTASAGSGAFQRAVSHITNAYNNCGLADNVSATQSFMGSTSTAPNVGSTASCLTHDGKSVVGFGTLPSNYLGMTCWWTMNGAPVEADMKLNKAYYHWYVSRPSDCSNKWSVEAAATHEFGHVFGLAHVSETYHPNLTMSPVIRSCQASEITLGLGDVRGLEALY